MANKHKERVSTSLVVREMQIKAIMIYCCTPTIMAKIKRTNNPCVGKDVEKPESPPTADWNIKWYRYVGKQFGSCLKSSTYT